MKKKMNIDDLWVGDDVALKASGIKGKFLGKGKNDLYKIRSADGKLMEVTADELDFGSSGTDTTKQIKKDPSHSGSESKRQSAILNLDYETLKNVYPRVHDQILDFQLEVCEEFINTKKEKKETYCKILFGDDAELKSAVAALLRKHPEVSIYTPHPDRDAWEVRFDFGGEEE